ncbi:MAG: paraquat-inducible protein A [Planctomycetes bacterium]|nr:paraquat-inducible protein A [Planctomycetota bacterium]
MADRAQSLSRERPRRIDVPAIAGLGLALLGFGVALPAIEFDHLFGGEVFSVLSGIWGFVTAGNILLGVLLFGFSVLFPIAKLGTILWIWFRPVAPADRREAVEWLELLGKWSLLDAFVIAVLIGTVQLGILTEASARPGVYVYLGAILLSLVATLLLRPLVRVADRERATRPLRRPGLWLTLPAAVCYGAGLSLPLLEVEKGWFWSNRFSILEGLGELFTAGDWGLALAVAVFVVVLPTLRCLAIVALRVLRAADERLARAVLVLDRLSMVEVFLVALLVVFTKLGSLASPRPLAGMWFLIAAAALTVVDSFVIQRVLRRA